MIAQAGKAQRTSIITKYFKIGKKRPPKGGPFLISPNYLEEELSFCLEAFA